MEEDDDDDYGALVLNSVLLNPLTVECEISSL